MTFLFGKGFPKPSTFSDVLMEIWRKVKGSAEKRARTGPAAGPPQGPLRTTEPASSMTSQPVRQTWPPEVGGQDPKATSSSPLPCTVVLKTEANVIDGEQRKVLSLRTQQFLMLLRAKEEFLLDM